MDRLLQSYLGQIKVGEEQTYKNLTAYPVLSNQVSALDYITLDEALKQGLIEISEIDKDGSVPELKLTNKSERMILILDGEEITQQVFGLLRGKGEQDIRQVAGFGYRLTIP